MVRWQNWKYVHYVGHAPQLFDLQSDPDERCDLGTRTDDADILEVIAEGERRLRAICDPDAVNVRCFADQKKRIAALGGEAACLDAAVFNHTPSPNERRP
jgi:choline-sulfatase